MKKTNESFTLTPAMLRVFKAHRQFSESQEDYGICEYPPEETMWEMARVLLCEHFGMFLPIRTTSGSHLVTIDDETVKVKVVTGRSRPVFDDGEGYAQHLMVVRMEPDIKKMTVIYNGPERTVRPYRPVGERQQDNVALKVLKQASKIATEKQTAIEPIKAPKKRSSSKRKDGVFVIVG